MLDRTLFAKRFFEQLAAEQTKPVDVSPKRGKSLFGRWRSGGRESKPHPSPAPDGSAESSNSNTAHLHHLITRLKSKQPVL